MNLKLTRGHGLAEIWAQCLSLKEGLERAQEVPRTIIEGTSINQLEGVGSMVGRKELIKEQAQLAEEAAARFSIWDWQNSAAALHPLGGASVLRGIAHTSQLCRTPRQHVFMGALLHFIPVGGCSSKELYVC